MSATPPSTGRFHWKTALFSAGIVTVVVCVLVVILLVVFRRTIFELIFGLWVEEPLEKLGAVANWSPKTVEGLWFGVTILFSGLAAWMWKSDSPYKQYAGWAGLCLMFASFFGFYNYFTREHYFDQKTGAPLHFISFRETEVYVSWRPGFDPTDGRPLLKATRQSVRDAKLIYSRSLQEVTDPTSMPWFHDATGQPMLWHYRRHGTNLTFWNRPGRHPSYQSQLLPVTPELREELEPELKRISGIKAEEARALAEKVEREKAKALDAKLAEENARLAKAAEASQYKTRAKLETFRQFLEIGEKQQKKQLEILRLMETNRPAEK